MAIRRVRGRSMEPTLSDGQLVVFSSLKTPRADAIVLSSQRSRDVVKRVYVEGNQYSLRGDNLLESAIYERITPSEFQATLVYPHH